MPCASRYHSAYQVILKFSWCVFVSSPSLSNPWGAWGSLCPPFLAQSWPAGPVILPLPFTPQLIAIWLSLSPNDLLPAPGTFHCTEHLTTHRFPKLCSLGFQASNGPNFSNYPAPSFCCPPPLLQWKTTPGSPSHSLSTLSVLTGFKPPYSEASESMSSALSSLQGSQLRFPGAT